MLPWVAVPLACVGLLMGVRGNTTGWWMRARATLLAAEGRPEEAIAVADELATHWLAVTFPARLWWRSLKAQALDRLGRRVLADAAYTVYRTV